MSEYQPLYLATWKNGSLAEKVETARSRLKQCCVCARCCRADRLSDETGVCRTGASASVSSFSPHFGEEAPLVGSGGSGTIFFTHCSLGCMFCQNYDLSHEGAGTEVTPVQLADMMLQLQAQGCHNINFVTPSHVVPQILEALELAVTDGLAVPLVYNTSAYDSLETLRLLEGVIDIYMPDFKFWDPEVALRTCQAPDYPEVARQVLLEMHRQVGDLVVDAAGVARRGMLIRHLVLPCDLAGTHEVMHFIAEQLSPRSYVNIMAQYRPCGRAAQVPELARRITAAEYQAALDAARAAGLERLD